MTVTIPLRTVSESNARDHWVKRAKRTKQARTTVGLVVGAMVRSGAVAPPCEVFMTRVAPSGGLDDDNVRGALKATRDGIADALGITDNDVRVAWHYAQRRGPWAVEIRIAKAQVAA